MTQLEDFGTRKEAFDVVLIPDGKSELTCTPDDFVRVYVEATDPLSAQMTEVVATKMAEGHRFLFVTKPGMLTDPEMQARARVHQMGYDRSKV